MTALFTVVTTEEADRREASVPVLGMTTRTGDARPRGRGRLVRVLLLVLLAGLALPATAPGAGAAQPAGAGNVHLSAPGTSYAATGESHARIVTRGDEEPAPEQHDDNWIPLLALAGLLVAAPVGYLAHSRRREAG
ncbi:hypothetical protein [Amycolatopsis jiangsuensis]|uniref:Uncharacterized protein n=1 Tax=Amycolatopsis jiangsuensis TaxID=1181879 RepID=A0A840J0Q0_9PSEU|nr:hypothetical protein [Amycolatopsis jiangsuensis]MBB4688546.1 hypothetical protein [Amycolatopsis jiangsuensis]